MLTDEQRAFRQQGLEPDEETALILMGLDPRSGYNARALQLFELKLKLDAAAQKKGGDGNRAH